MTRRATFTQAEVKRLKAAAGPDETVAVIGGTLMIVDKPAIDSLPSVEKGGLQSCDEVFGCDT